MNPPTFSTTGSDDSPAKALLDRVELGRLEVSGRLARDAGRRSPLSKLLPRLAPPTSWQKYSLPLLLEGAQYEYSTRGRRKWDLDRCDRPHDTTARTGGSFDVATVNYSRRKSDYEYLHKLIHRHNPGRCPQEHYLEEIRREQCVLQRRIEPDLQVGRRFQALVHLQRHRADPWLKSTSGRCLNSTSTAYITKRYNHSTRPSISPGPM